MGIGNDIPWIFLQWLNLFCWGQRVMPIFLISSNNKKETMDLKQFNLALDYWWGLNSAYIWEKLDFQSYKYVGPNFFIFYKKN